MAFRDRLRSIGFGLLFDLLRIGARRIVNRVRSRKDREIEVEVEEGEPMTEAEIESYNRARNRAAVAANVQSNHNK